MFAEEVKQGDQWRQTLTNLYLIQTVTQNLVRIIPARCLEHWRRQRQQRLEPNAGSRCKKGAPKSNADSCLGNSSANTSLALFLSVYLSHRRHFVRFVSQYIAACTSRVRFVVCLCGWLVLVLVTVVQPLARANEPASLWSNIGGCSFLVWPLTTNEMITCTNQPHYSLPMNDSCSQLDSNDARILNWVFTFSARSSLASTLLVVVVRLFVCSCCCRWRRRMGELRPLKAIEAGDAAKSRLVVGAALFSQLPYFTVQLLIYSIEAQSNAAVNSHQIAGSLRK